jgi:Ca2+-transporting ATPase
VTEDRRDDVEDRPDWHAMATDEVVASLDTDAITGLSAGEAASRLDRFGPNELAAREGPRVVGMFLGQFNDYMIWVLFAALVLSAVQGREIEAIAIAAILVLNGVLGFVQEYQAERAMEALKDMAAPEASVIRGGRELEVPARELVTGDLVVLEAGDRVPADGRLVEAAALRVDEASLTGESRAVLKRTDAVFGADLALGDRSDMMFAATTVSVGRGRLVVTSTGQSTEMGRVAELLSQTEEDRTPLQQELRQVGKVLAIAILAIALFVFITGVFEAQLRLGGSFLANLHNADFRSVITTQLLVAISLAVAAIPEGLPAVVTLTLSIGVKAMAERNAIVRNLHSVETLGATSFIATDKTGTLTRNEMRVTRLQVGPDLVEVTDDWGLTPVERAPDAADLELLLEVAASANDARYDADGDLFGDPTETALVEAAQQLTGGGMRPRRIGEIPFDSERKRMTTLHRIDDSEYAYMKGATDVVLALCDRALIRGVTVPLTSELSDRFSADNESLAGDGFRTLAFALRRLPADLGVDLAAQELDAEVIERGMVFLGIAGIVDPPRAEVPAAIAIAHRAGIQVAMVTGDHALTAEAIGRQIGLLEGGRVVTGAELERMTDEELTAEVDSIRIYARVNPEHKLRIVEALKRRGHVVAMTGDGVNDAPALKRADIGVAMGDIGTDVAREASDMVLADDDFATIVEAVHRGRVVYDNIKKTVLYLLSCNTSEVLIVFIPTFFIARPALLPLQLLWNNLVTDGAPALALGVDPAEPDVMARGPRDAGQGILTRRNQVRILWQGALLTVGGLAVFWYGEAVMPDHKLVLARTMLFTTMMLSQLLHSLNYRVPSGTIWSRESLRNRWLLLAAAVSLVAQLLIIYVPWLQRIFQTAPLGPGHWVAVALAAIVPVALIDAIKVALVRRRERGAAGQAA